MLNRMIGQNLCIEFIENHRYFYCRFLLDACFQPPGMGICRPEKSNYYFNIYTERCELSSFGDCLSNSNSFESLLECRISCETIK